MTSRVGGQSKPAKRHCEGDSRNRRGISDKASDQMIDDQIKLAVFAPLLIPGSEARRGSVLGHEIKIDSAVLISSG
jgi:hypothetical protein